ncbi:MAG: diaminopimelate decarboxylase [Methanomassiliicoccales archaeon]|jgi:diaminopimelate decarboxylase|nr:diaminopimelate decarboxylase [Methanomassiliicoccales archaeon]HPD08674.1 diaminopimelate decarboxylase [Methanomassiliicoccales archaeon]HRU11275.1 diaminopimelate decarboxylase [Methanomassiliicoccales archaeon]
MREFQRRKDTMLIGGVSATKIAARFGTPVMVTDEDALRENYRALHRAFNAVFPTRVHYACKANTNLSILRILEQEGSCIDAVSIGEVESCLRAGFSPDRILYTGVGVSEEEMRQVVERKVPINVDSIGQLRRLAAIDSHHPIALRVNPDVGAGHSQKVVTGTKGAKFGIPKEEIVQAFAEALRLGFSPKGLHAHTGSGGSDPTVFGRVTEVLVDIFERVRSELGLDLEFLDIGGGISIPYRPEELRPDLDAIAAEVAGKLKGSSVRTLVVEPGRYIVADTTVLLTRVNDVKSTPVKDYVLVDAGFNTLIRPAFYDAYHHVAVANKFGQQAQLKYDVAGPLCESGDYLAKERYLPKVEVGDLLCVYDVGAYGFSMSSNYNTRPRCAEVLVWEGKPFLIREREGLKDLLRHQKVPPRLSQ